MEEISSLPQRSSLPLLNMFEWIAEPIDNCAKDTDRDGVSDCDDKCPREKGSPNNEGCPARDRDSDSIPDDEDACYNPKIKYLDNLIMQHSTN